MPVLSPAQIETEVQTLNHWQYLTDEIATQLTFDTFDDAYRFVRTVAELAIKLNHHPTFFWSYTQLTLTLATHDEGGITEKDIALAKLVDQIDIPRES
ncbi:MAG: 4a-hydroxytetrahydrobiopterin dehydratase [Armatimonadetes bacterium]|nr:4a-hydroxytetrahydrobiopterin dehydratase [Armatimonadota bacterium]